MRHINMKKLNLEQELEIIQSAEPNKLLKIVMKQRLSPKGEKALIRRGLTDISLFYIKAYGLGVLSQIEVFKSNTPILVEALLERATPEILETFLSHGEYNTVMKYLKRHDVPNYKEKDLIWSKNEAEILHYMEQHRLSPFAKLDIIMRKKDVLTLKLIVKNKLNEREKLAIMRFGSYDCVMELIEVQSNRKEADKLRQMKLIRFGSDKQIENFIRTQRFKADVEEFFYQFGSFRCLVSYFKRYTIENGQDILLKRNERTEILGYLSKHWLCEESEKLLLKRGVHSEIKAYIKKHYFHDEQEVKFIKRGKHREIMLYISVHSLNDKAQMELIYRRNQEEIMYYISHYPLAECAVEVLYKCGTEIAWDLWMQNPLGEEKSNTPQPEKCQKPKIHRAPSHEFLRNCAAWQKLSAYT